MEVHSCRGKKKSLRKACNLRPQCLGRQEPRIQLYSCSVAHATMICGLRDSLSDSVIVLLSRWASRAVEWDRPLHSIRTLRTDRTLSARSALYPHGPHGPHSIRTQRTLPLGAALMQRCTRRGLVIREVSGKSRIERKMQRCRRRPSASIFWVARRANESDDVEVFRLASPDADDVGVTTWTQV